MAIPASAAAFDPAPEIRVMPTRSGSLTLELDGVALASRMDPAREAESLIGALDPLVEWIWMVGWGTGHLARAALTRCPRAHLLVYEPNPTILAAALAQPELARGSDDARVTLATEPFALRFAFEEQFLPGASIATVVPPVYRRLVGGAVDELLAALDQSRVRVEANVLSRLVVGGTWLDHLLRNAAAIAAGPFLEELRDRFRGVPAICVAAGPSLETNADVLRDAGDRALLISVGSALKPLLRRGVEPHFAAAIEWREAVLKQFEDVDLARVFLLLSAVSHPDLHRLTAAGRFTEIPMGSPATTWLSEVLGVESGFLEGGSVAHTAFSTALLLGCEPIVMVGQDLALGPDRHTHAASSLHGHIVADPPDPSSNDPRQRRYVLPGYHGGEVETLREFYCYHAWFEDRIHQLDGARRILNATEGGARIRGTVQVTLREVVDALPRIGDLRPILADAVQRSRRRDPSVLRAALHERRRVAGRASRLAREALTQLDILLRRGAEDGGGVSRDARRLDRLERELTRILEDDPLIRSLTGAAMYRFERLRAAGPPADRAAAYRWSLELSRLIHQGVGVAARDLAPVLDSVIAALPATA